MKKYPTRKPIRLQGYDYSLNGYYFITICSKNRQDIFGKHKNIVGEGLASSRYDIKLSEIGKIIDKQWDDIPRQYCNIKIDEYIVMPNHIHGIMIIDKQN